MKTFLLLILFFVVSPTLARAEALMLAYRDFGPQAMAHELIGAEWWQWNSHGDSDPEVEYPIRVVVYWEQTLNETKNAYPIFKRAMQDFRYVRRDQAIAYLEKAQKECSDDDFSGAEELRNRLKKTLEQLKATLIKNQGLPSVVEIQNSRIEMPVFFPKRVQSGESKSAEQDGGGQPATRSESK